MFKSIFFCLTLWVVSPSLYAGQKKTAQAQPLKEIRAKVKWGHKITKMKLSIGKKNQIVLENTSGKKRSETLDQKDSEFIIKEFSRLPASTISKNCDDPMIIEIQRIPSDGRKRSLCLNKQPKTATIRELFRIKGP